ncbi:nuclease [Cyanobium sp. WAJ14-Wanaka]|nr:nuclease [Cyanobium sp. WAJ14-Wanaka]
MLSAVLLLVLAPFGLASAAQAAEVLQVRSGTLLQVGDQNRNYSVQIACIEVSAADNDQATAWLRSQLPRRSKVNLRPIGQEAGVIVAKVQKLGSSSKNMGNNIGNDMGGGLVDAGLAQNSCSGSATS